MRLSVLDSGHKLRTKVLFKFIETVSRMPVQDVVKTLMYRPDFFGAPMGSVFQTAMRGPSEWAVAEREMMVVEAVRLRIPRFLLSFLFLRVIEERGMIFYFLNFHATQPPTIKPT